MKSFMMQSDNNNLRNLKDILNPTYNYNVTEGLPCTKYCSKCFLCIISLNMYNNPAILLLCLLYRWGNLGIGEVNL